MKNKATSKLIVLISILLLFSTAESMARPTASQWKRGGTDLYPLNIDLIKYPQATHSNNANLVNYLFNHTGGSAGHYKVNTSDWTYAWYWTEDATTNCLVTGAGQYDHYYNSYIPWNPSWSAPGGTDAQVIITDNATGKEIELYGVGKYTAGNPCTVQVQYANYVAEDEKHGSPDVAADYRLKDNGWATAWAVGIPYTKRVTTRAELENGAVTHALSMPSNLESSGYVAPAIESDGPGKDGNSYPVPAGTRFQLNPAKWTDASCDSWASGKYGSSGTVVRNAAYRDIAAKLCKGLLHYGAFISDQAGTTHIQLEANGSANWNSYCVSGDCANPSDSYIGNLLDGLFTSTNDWKAIVPSNQYVIPNQLLAPPNPPSGITAN
jgi:hypothetical protein